MSAQMCPAVHRNPQSPWVEKADRCGMYGSVCPVGVCLSYSLMASGGHGLGVWGADTQQALLTQQGQLLCVLLTVLIISAWKDWSDTVQG